MLFVLVGAVAGVYVVARPYTVLALAPVVLFCAAGAMFAGIVAHHHPRTITIEALGAIASPQIAFIVVSLRTYLRAISRFRLLP
jgi:hypothetical protein